MAEYVLIGVGAITLVIALIVQFIRHRRRLSWSFHRRAGVTFEAVLFPAIVFFFAAAAMQWLIPENSHGAEDHTVATHQETTVADEPIDPRRSVLITNVAMLAGAIAAYAVAKRCLASPSRGVIWMRRGAGRQVTDGVVGVMSAFALCYVTLQATLWILTQLNPQFAPVEHTAIEAVQAPERPAWLLPVVWIGTCVVAPIGEELFFRGLIQTALLRSLRRRWLAIIITAATFGAAHASQPHVVPAIFVFGLILGVLYERRAALAGPIVAHALFNAKTILWLTLSSR